MGRIFPHPPAAVPASKGVLAPMAEAQLDTAGLIRTHQAGVWRYLRFLGCATGEADDLTQETFLAVLRRPFRDEGVTAAAAYLRSVARHLFLKQRERSARAVTLDLEAAERHWERVAGEDGGERYVDALRQCLEKIEERERRALDLLYRDGLSRIAVGEALGLSDDGAKSLLRKTRALLRACIERNLQP